MAMSVRACFNLLPGLDSCGPDYALALQVFQYRFRKLGFIKDNGSPDQHFSFKRSSARVSQATALNDNVKIEASTCVCDGQFIEVGVSGT
jgi:hypothetical protein